MNEQHPNKPGGCGCSAGNPAAHNAPPPRRFADIVGPRPQPLPIDDYDEEHEDWTDCAAVWASVLPPLDPEADLRCEAKHRAALEPLGVEEDREREADRAAMIRAGTLLEPLGVEQDREREARLAKMRREGTLLEPLGVEQDRERIDRLNEMLRTGKVFPPLGSPPGWTFDDWYGTPLEDGDLQHDADGFPQMPSVYGLLGAPIGVLPKITDHLSISTVADRYLECTLGPWRLSLPEKRALLEEVRRRHWAYEQIEALETLLPEKPLTEWEQEELVRLKKLLNEAEQIANLNREIETQECRADQWIKDNKGRGRRALTGAEHVRSQRERELIVERITERLVELGRRISGAEAMGAFPDRDDVEESGKLSQLLSRLQELEPPDPRPPDEIVLDALRRMKKATRCNCFFWPIISAFFKYAIKLNERTCRYSFTDKLRVSPSDTEPSITEGLAIELRGHCFRDTREGDATCGTTPFGFAGFTRELRTRVGRDLPYPVGIDLCALREDPCNWPAEAVCEAKRIVTMQTLLHELIHWAKAIYATDRSVHPELKRSILAAAREMYDRCEPLPEGMAESATELIAQLEILLKPIDEGSGHSTSEDVIGEVKLDNPNIRSAFVRLIGQDRFDELLRAIDGRNDVSGAEYFHVIEYALWHMCGYGARLAPGFRSTTESLGSNNYRCRTIVRTLSGEEYTCEYGMYFRN